MEWKREALSHITLEGYQAPILMGTIMAITMIIPTLTMIHVHIMQPQTMDMELESEVLKPSSLEHIMIMDFIIETPLKILLHFSHNFLAYLKDKADEVY